MFIEDLIDLVTGYNSWVYTKQIKLSSPFENKFMESVSHQISNGNGLTEKQAGLVVKILKAVEPELIAQAGAKKWDLDSPQFKLPIRTINQQRSVSINNNENPSRIVVFFPYDEVIVNAIKEYKRTRNGFTADWNPDQKCWVFSLIEDNIRYINKNIVPLGFTVDDEFKNFVEQLEFIENNLESFVPMLSLQDGQPKFLNTHKSVPQPNDNNLVKALFLARKYGITATDDNIVNHPDFINSQPVTKTLMNSTNHIWVDKRKHGVEQFNDVVDYAQPLLIVIPGGHEHEHISSWNIFLNSRGITNQEISVMFRLPNEGKGDFNLYVRDNKLNNEITENTKVVFISVKVPKPLIKTNIKFDAIINLGYYMNTHYSLETLVRSAGTLIFYTDQEPKIPKYGHR